MGVIYKLTPEVSSFIIEQKQNDPKITCQSLSSTVFLKFGQQVSKSSVHALLKQAQVITTRPRKIKDNISGKFQIPIEKKFEISQALAPFVETQAEPVVLPSTQEILTPGMGEVFLKAALWDLSGKPILEIKDLSEWEYLTQLVYAIKVETQEKDFYIDPRFGGLYAQNPNQEILAAPIERAACEVADYILNNIKPLIIRELSTEDKTTVDNFFGAFENEEGKKIKKICLIGKKNRSFSELEVPLAHKREFIAGISDDNLFKEGAITGVRIIKNNDKFIVTNCQAMSDEEIVQKYLDRHPSIGAHLNLAPPLAGPLRGLLKQRTLMFFSLNFSLEDLEKVMALPGYEKEGQIYLKFPEGFQLAQGVKIAAENVNSLYIRTPQEKNLRILIQDVMTWTS